MIFSFGAGICSAVDYPPRWRNFIFCPGNYPGGREIEFSPEVIRRAEAAWIRRPAGGKYTPGNPLTGNIFISVKRIARRICSVKRNFFFLLGNLLLLRPHKVLGNAPHNSLMETGARNFFIRFGRPLKASVLPFFIRFDRPVKTLPFLSVYASGRHTTFSPSPLSCFSPSRLPCTTAQLCKQRQRKIQPAEGKQQGRQRDTNAAADKFAETERHLLLF